MPDIDDVAEAIASNAAGPKKVQVGNQSVEQHPIADQIKAADFLAARGAAARPHFGLRLTKLVPPGCG